MAKIYTVRHAESVANTEGVYQGQTYDTNLSALGKKQAEAVAKAFKDIQLDKIVSSPLRRTIQTAELISKSKNMPVIKEPDLIETNHGKWEGHDKKWIIKKYPKTFKKWLIKPLFTKFPGGESFEQTVERVAKYIFDTHWEGNTLLTAHDNIVRIMIAFAKNMDMNNIWKIDLDPAGITKFKVVGVNGTKRLKLLELNKIEHLKKLRSDLDKHAL